MLPNDKPGIAEAKELFIFAGNMFVNIKTMLSQKHGERHI